MAFLFSDDGACIVLAILLVANKNNVFNTSAKNRHTMIYSLSVIVFNIIAKCMIQYDNVMTK